MRKRTIALGATVLLGLVGSSEAGIVVLKNGEVVVGKLHEPKSGKSLKMTWPHGSVEGRGVMRIDRRDVRWADRGSDGLTDAYFAEHLGKPLKGAKWIYERGCFLEKRAKQPTIKCPPIDVDTLELLMSMSPLEREASRGEGFELRRPAGWGVETDEHGILIFRAPKQPGHGFRPRIHVFSVRSARIGFEDQVGWIREELRRTRGAKGFEIVKAGTLTVDENGASQVIHTETKLKTRTIRALREVRFVGERTFFFSAYADARDMPALEGLLEQSLGTWRLDSDRRRD